MAKPSSPRYQAARREQLEAADSTIVYGIPLEDADSADDKLVIWFCGIADGGREVRVGSKRIVHLPNTTVESLGEVEGFTYEGHQVQALRVKIGTTAIEEHFSPVSIGGLLHRPFRGLARRRGGFASDCFHDCLAEAMDQCSAHCRDTTSHPPELGWTPDEVQNCISECVAEAAAECIDTHCDGGGGGKFPGWGPGGGGGFGGTRGGIPQTIARVLRGF